LLISVRSVCAKDLLDVLEILNREIAEGFAHFGTELQTRADIEREFSQASQYPWFAAFDEGRLVGFARASAWKARGGYSRTCEVGVYVRPELQGQGIGRQLFEVFIPELQSRGFKTLLGGIALPNPASVQLHEKFDFRHVGTLPSVGWKQGAWRDVGYWALTFPDVE
jgi:L-amino acid N-acyltransferase YncA